jgi:hypothetical protein
VSFLPIVAEAAKIAIAVIILYYVVLLLPMPRHMQQVVQALIILVAILVVLSMFVGTPIRPALPASPGGPPSITR